MKDSAPLTFSPLSVDLDNCDREPIHIPGSIQPHGYLLACQPETLALKQASANVLNLTGLSLDELFSQGLSAIFTPEQIRKLQQAVSAKQVQEQTGVIFSTPLAGESRYPLWNLVAHQFDGNLILELEPETPDAPERAPLFQELNHAVARLKAADGLQGFLEALAREVKALNGFDRVMIYRFDAEGNGQVITEEREAELEPFLGLHYPASDIPKQARALYLKNRLRFITDVNYQPVVLLPELNEPVNLSHAVLRSVSPIHVEYLQNMDVSATMTISIIRNGQLWGLIACHHYTPRYVRHDIRTACDYMGTFASLELDSRLHQESVMYSASLKSMHRDFVEFMVHEPSIVSGLMKYHPNLADYIDADGAIILLEGQYESVGKVPPRDFVDALMNWLGTQLAEDDDHFVTHSLPEVFPEAMTYKTVASGILAIPLAFSPGSFIIWFRPEVIQTIHWGGDPNKPAQVPENGARLTPRGSFALWKETLQCNALPWTPQEIEAALEVRSSISRIGLYKAGEKAREQQQKHALIESEEQFKTLANSIPQLAWMTNADGYIFWYNQRWYEYTGTTLEEMQGWGWQSVHDPTQLERIIARFKNALSTGEYWEDTFQLRGKDGQFRWFLSQARPIRNSQGELVRWFGTNTDITQQREVEATLTQRKQELEQVVSERTAELEAANERLMLEMEERSKAEDALRQSQKMEAVGQLTGGLAHDFNNLLTVILGNVEMAQSKSSGHPQLAKYLSQVASAADRGKNLTQQLLAFSRRQQLNASTLNLNAVISELADLVTKTLGANITFETRLSPALWSTTIDRTQLELAVINVLVNARDAMELGGGTIMINTRNVELNEEDATAFADLSAGRYVCLSITDDGSGMAPDVLERITEPFYTTKDIGKGTGLGLSQVYGFVRQSDGQLNIYSEPRMGTTVRMYFPAAEGENAVATNDLVEPAEDRQATILVVEDNPEVRDLACNILVDQGYHVLCAENAGVAMEWIERGSHVDVLFSDVAMPGGMNGVTLATEVHRRYPDVKILLTTGFANDVIKSGERLQFKVLQKPYRPSDLVLWIKRLLEDAAET